MSTETKFTKGEWRVVSTGKHRNNENLENLQICYSDIGECICDTVYEEQDAHLIAAAPEMYVMLENSLNEIYMLVNKVNEKGAGFTNYDDMYIAREIKYLLAKARGESQ